MRRFLVLLRKEVKELITPQILLPFVITIMMFAVIGQVVGAEGEEAAANRRLALLDRDRTEASSALRAAIEGAGFTIEEAADDDAGEAARALSASGGSILVVVPEGYGAALGDATPARIEVYSVIRTFSVMSGQDSAALSAALLQVEQTVAQEVMTEHASAIDPAFIKDPLAVVDHVMVGDRQAQVSRDTVMAFISTQTMLVPIVLFVVVMFAAQMVAVAIATEKENKTLETLLAMPISRSAIVTAKMMAAGLVALVSAAAYMVGMNIYMKGLMEGFGETGTSTSAATAFADQLGLTLGVGDYAMLGLSMFAAILVALVISLILGAFAENVKAVQSLITPMIVLLMVPYFVSMFVDVNSLAPVARWTVLAIPFTHAFLAAPNLFLGNAHMVLLGAAYELAWFAVLVVVAGRIFSSDRLLTMRLNLAKLKKKR
jgi:ABC-2 type transport system permease protein